MQWTSTRRPYNHWKSAKKFIETFICNMEPITTFGIGVCWFEPFLCAMSCIRHYTTQDCMTKWKFVKLLHATPKHQCYKHRVHHSSSSCSPALCQLREKRTDTPLLYDLCCVLLSVAGWIGCSYRCLVDAVCELPLHVCDPFSFFSCKSQWEPQVSSRSRVISEPPLAAFFKCGPHCVSSVGVTAMNVELKSTNSILILFYNICMQLMLMCLLLNETAIKKKKLKKKKKKKLQQQGFSFNASTPSTWKWLQPQWLQV